LAAWSNNLSQPRAKFHARGFNWDGHYIELDRAGFEQAPTCSNWEHVENMRKTFVFAAGHIDPSRLKGFVLASWKPTLAKFQDYHLEGIRAFGEASKGRKR
jgi:hypothetical protein